MGCNYSTMDGAYSNGNRYVVKGQREHLHVINFMRRTANACVVLAQAKDAHQK